MILLYMGVYMFNNRSSNDDHVTRFSPFSMVIHIPKTIFTKQNTTNIAGIRHVRYTPTILQLSFTFRSSCWHWSKSITTDTSTS